MYKMLVLCSYHIYLEYIYCHVIFFLVSNKNRFCKNKKSKKRQIGKNNLKLFFKKRKGGKKPKI